ncbi:MAG: ABC transporter permease [Oscillospiraceae bacterium]|nr:ABC transporter permease [Oscillospiraceae bacterium]
MRNLLRADFYKLKKSKAFWICTLLGIAIAVLMVVAEKAAVNLAATGAGGDSPVGEMASAASGVWAVTMSLTQQHFNIILMGIFAAIFISSEFGYGTMKNTLSRGAQRWKVFASKFVTCGAGALFMVLTFMGALLAMGTAFWGFDPQGNVSAGGFIGMILLQMLLMLSFAAVFTFISMTIRAGGGAIATNIITVLIVSTLLSAVNLLFNSNTVDLNKYWLTRTVETLATTAPASGDVTRGIVVALAWGVGSLALGTVLFNKQDVK